MSYQTFTKLSPRGRRRAVVVMSVEIILLAVILIIAGCLLSLGDYFIQLLLGVA